MKRFYLAISIAFGFVPLSFADTVIVMEDFESYADTAAMQAVWVPSGATDISRIAGMAEDPDAFPAGGQGAEHLGGAVNIWNGLNSGNALHPSASQSVQLEVDIWHAEVGNKRLAMGLRGAGANLIELGAWNANTCDPTVAGCVPGTTEAGGPGFIAAAGQQMAHRLQLFGGFTAPLTVQPNWQYFDLPEELDASANGVTSLDEVNAGWHRYTATITPDAVTLSIDLYRDGVRNISTTPGDGTPDVPDAEVTWNVITTAAGFSDLRFGGPSNVTSAGGSLIFDNIKLSLIDVVAPPDVNADFNGNSVVDAADYVVWRDNLGTGTLQTQGDADNDGDVDNDDYLAWKATFGTTPSGSGAGNDLSSVTVPEPATAMMLMLAGLAALAAGRRRT